MGNHLSENVFGCMKRLADIANHTTDQKLRIDYQAEAMVLIRRMVEKHGQALASLLLLGESIPQVGKQATLEEAVQSATEAQGALEGKSRLFLLREGKGMSQRKAAKQMGIPANRFQRLESGIQEPYAHEMSQLAEFYGLSLDDFVAVYAGTTMDEISFIDVGKEGAFKRSPSGGEETYRANATKLATLRFKEDMSLRGVATAMDIGASKFQRLESGDQKLTAVEMMKFAKFYRVPLAEIVSICASLSKAHE
ncbi:MAG: helix-turn-helix transcriptional regulator [Candidatus Peregrinibacteria bacterium]